MTKKEENKPVIYVAEPSKLLCKLICSLLNENGYETKTFSDGLSILKQIAQDSPDCIIADKVLPVIDGVELCRIIKEGSNKSDIPFILISAENEVLDFWTGETGANKILAVSSDNLNLLIHTVKNLLSYKRVRMDTFFDTDKNKNKDVDDMLLWTVEAMDKSNFFHNMLNKIMSLYSYVQKPNLLVSKCFSMMHEICNYDICTMILNGSPSVVYKAGTANLIGGTGSPADEDFWQICKTEYEKNIKDIETISYETKQILDAPCKSQNPGELCSYRSFIIKAGNHFVGTIHFASLKKKAFDYKMISSIEYILPSLSYLLQEAVHCERTTLTEFRLRSAFSKFVPPEVIQDILSSKGIQEEQTSNNEKRKIVILMSDIRNFTSISEINQPEDVVNFLNAYFTQMVEIVTKYGGTVDKFIGDAIMVLFGAPVSYNDNAQRAVNAAIEMYERLEEVPLGQLKFPEGIDFDIGIGLHYGDVIVGNIGSKDKTNYTVIGDAVNLASRLEGLTKLYGAKVIISEAVEEEISKDTNTLLLDTVKVKGKTTGVRIYRAESKPLPAEYSGAYEKGFKLYSEGAWNLAKPYFRQALEILPEDKAAKLMLERCIEFEKTKPKDWDGAIALTSK